MYCQKLLFPLIHEALDESRKSLLWGCLTDTDSALHPAVLLWRSCGVYLHLPTHTHKNPILFVLIRLFPVLSHLLWNFFEIIFVCFHKYWVLQTAICSVFACFLGNEAARHHSKNEDPNKESHIMLSFRRLTLCSVIIILFLFWFLMATEQTSEVVM